MKSVQILGSEYRLKEEKYSESDFMKANELDGYCDWAERTIVYADTSEKEHFCLDSKEAKERVRNHIIRHELIHAFLSESGLKDCAMAYDKPWPINEEMVDWFASMLPKIFAACEEVRCLE